jgi:hypothetical protein
MVTEEPFLWEEKSNPGGARGIFRHPIYLQHVKSTFSRGRFFFALIIGSK